MVFVSAKTGEGIKELEARIELFLNSLDSHIELLIPFTRGDIVSRVHQYGTIVEEEYTPEGTRMEVRVPPSLARELKDFCLSTP